jgi:predicted SprT family Zn-dependent metalloprotease
MELSLAKRMIEELLAQHGVDSWAVVFDNAVRRRGQTNYDKKEISLSIPITVNNPIEQVRNTILHEVAHVLVGQGHGHDNVWRTKAVEIGCTGETCTTILNRVPRVYALKCNHCGETFDEFYRRPKTVDRWHIKCGRVSKNKLELIRK